MSSIALLEKAKKILEEQQSPIEATKDHSVVKNCADKLKQAIMYDIESNNNQMVSDNVDELFSHRLQNETSNSTSAKDNVVEAIYLLEQEIARLKSLEQLHALGGNRHA